MQSIKNAPPAPLLFIRNDGQTDPSVAYHVKGYGKDYFFTRDSVKIPVPGPGGGPGRIVSLRPQWLDATADLVPGPQAQAYFNFYRGQDPAKWQIKTPAFESVTYRHPATGIELVWYARGEQLEYDVVLPAGVDPGQARFRVEGARAAHLDQDGALVIETADGGRLIQAPPRLHQMIDGQAVPVEGRFDAVKKGQDGWSYGFVAAGYDRTRPLVIDPTLAFNKPINGNGIDTIKAVAVAATGEIYICGVTTSSDLGSGTPTLGKTSAFLTQNDTAGNRVWTSYLDGTKTGGDETAYALAIFPAAAPVYAGHIAMVGQTNSTDLPVSVNAFNKGLHGTSVDAFMAIFDATGASKYCSYLGGSGTDIARGVAIDASSAFTIVGSTDSTDLPTAAALYPSKAGSLDGFITKFNVPAPPAQPIPYLSYLTYFGGSLSDTIHAVAVDDQGNTYVAGETTSANLPVKNALIAANPGTTAGFVTKLNTAGSGLVFSTYLGGKGVDSVQGLALDSTRNVYLTGKTSSTNFPVTNALYPTLAGDSDAFAVKLDASGRFLWYSTYLGGADADAGQSVAVNAATGEAYYAGTTESANFPVVDKLVYSANGLDNYFGTGASGVQDAFITKIDAAGARSVYSNYLGGQGVDEGTAVALDPSAANAVVLAGSTTKSALPPSFPFCPLLTLADTKKHGFLAKITDTGSPPANNPVLSLDRQSARSGQQVTLALTLSNTTANAVGALSANVVFDTAVLANPVVTFAPRLAGLNKTTATQALGTNTLRLSAYSNPGTSTTITSGAVATIRFDVLYDVPSQFCGVTLASTLSTPAGLALQGEQVNGGVHIRQRCGILGDCDCSGAVELWELQNALNIYLGPQVPPFCMVGDYGATLTAADLTTIINNYAIPPSAAAAEALADAPMTRQAVADAAAGLRLGTAEKRSDGWHVPVLYTPPTGTATSAVAARISYDASAYASVDARIGQAATDAGKQLLVNAKKPGVVAMMAISTTNAATIGEGVLAWLRLVPVAEPSSPLTALAQDGDASTPQGQAVAVTSTGKTSLALPPSAVPFALLLQ